MKRLSENHKQYLITKSRKEMRRRSKTPVIHIGRRVPGRLLGKREVITAPKKINFDDHTDETLYLIDRIQRYSVIKKLDLFIDLSPCIEIAPEAAMVLAAEVQRAMAIHPGTINGFDPRHSRARRMLVEMGFHELLNFRTRMSQVDSNRAIEYATIISGKGGRTDKISDLIRTVLGQRARTTGWKGYNAIATGVQEAMNNISHAYPSDTPPLIQPSPDHLWWMAGYRDARKKRVAIMFYDQGIGIPASLPKTWPEKFSTALGIKSDGDIIAAAFTVGRTATRTSGRGWGLVDMRATVGGPTGKNQLLLALGVDQGSLRVLSRNGDYLYTANTGEQTREISRPLNGTLVVWELANSPLIVWDNEDHGEN